MKSTLLKRIFFVVSIVGIAFSSTVIFDLMRQHFYARQVSTPKTLISQDVIDVHSASMQAFAHASSRAFPAHLKIPKIKVDVVLESVGLTKEGEVDIPKGPANPAWFDLGPRPGDLGNAVIVGHFGWKDGIPAVFDDLHRLEKGAKIYVEDSNGTTTTFIVRELKMYGAHDDARGVFVSGDGKAHLSLITCSGVWDKDVRSYSERFVVFADKE